MGDSDRIRNSNRIKHSDRIRDSNRVRDSDRIRASNRMRNSDRMRDSNRMRDSDRIKDSNTGWRRLVGSLKVQIIFHKRATRYRSLFAENDR